MNEIEIQKLLIKEAFAREKSFGGGLDEDSALKLRNYIWKVCNYLENQNPKRGHE